MFCLTKKLTSLLWNIHFNNFLNIKNLLKLNFWQKLKINSHYNKETKKIYLTWFLIKFFTLKIDP